MDKYRFPFRVGRKQGRAILDADGLEVVIFPEGAEEFASLTCKLYNTFYQHLKENWKGLEDE